MGFLCINKDFKKEVSLQELKEEKFLSDIGLNNINNLNPEINFCQEIFFSPEYYITGATKLVSGYTATLTGCTTGGTVGIYNLDYSGDITLGFIITGNTNYDEYNGDFCFKVYSKEYWNPTKATGSLVKGAQIVDSCTSFSAITTGVSYSYITQTFLEGSLAKTWQEYLIRPYYTFISKECNPGITFNSWDGMIQYNTFQDSTDYYFMTVVNPPTPILQSPSNASANANQVLITDKLYLNGVSGPLGPQSVNNELNYFILSSIPYNGQILLILNGVQLTQGKDFDLISQGFGVPPIVEIYGEIKTTDWLLATYITGVPLAASTDFGAYKIETIVLNSYTTTTTPSYRTSGDNTINYNPVTNNYEFFTSYPIDDANSIILTVNGVKLAPNEQFFVSTSFDGRIIFDKTYTTFNIGDIISVLYVTKKSGTKNNNYGSIPINQFGVQWTVPTTLGSSNTIGRFIINAYNKDTNVLLFQNYADFLEGQSNYSSTFTSLPLNVYFRFTVTFEVVYTGFLNNKVTTCSSAEGFFDTTNRYINNTY